jgi:hypothetical protein
MRGKGGGSSGTMARMLPFFSYNWFPIKLVDLCVSINLDIEMQNACQAYCVYTLLVLVF